MGHRVVAILAIAAFTLLSFAGPGQVLCFGDDGHIAIETHGAPCGSEGPSDGSSFVLDATGEPSTETAASPATERSPVKHCVDIGADLLMRHDSARQASHATHVAAALAFVAVARLFVAAPSATQPLVGRAGPPIPPPRLAALRTVVLLV